MNYIFDRSGMTPENSVHLPQLDLPPFDPTNPQHWRKSAEQMLEWMFDRQIEILAVMDAIDGDADIEENGDELDASYPERGPHVQAYLGEFEDSEGSDADEDDGTREPTLGAPEIPPTRLLPGGRYGWHTEQGSQAHWADGLAGDHERETEDEHGGDVQDDPHDDFGSGEAEPSLGWTETFNQASAHRFGSGIVDGEADYYNPVPGVDFVLAQSVGAGE